MCALVALAGALPLDWAGLDEEVPQAATATARARPAAMETDREKRDIELAPLQADEVGGHPRP